MRVLVVARPKNNQKGYGVERYTGELCNALSSIGIEVDALGDWPLAKRLAERIPPYGGTISALIYDSILPLLFVASRAGRCDVGHFIDVANAFPSVVLARLACRKNFVGVQSLNGISYLMMDPGGKSRADTLYVFYRSAAVRLARRFATALIAMSSTEEVELRKTLAGSRATTVNPGSGLRAPHVDPSGTGTLTIGCVGALVPNKRVEKAIKVVVNLRNTGLDCRLLVCGEGRSMERLRAFARGEGVESHVEFVGHISGGIERFYRGIDFLLFPSLRESFGYPLVEAARCGVPSITFSDSTLAPEVRDLSLTTSDENEAGRTIAELWRNPTRYSRVTREGREKAERFSPENMGRKLIELYRGATSSGQSKSAPSRSRAL